MIPAPEPTHAIAAVIREAKLCRESGESKVILMAMCGHGHFDLASYDKYLQGTMRDLAFEGTLNFQQKVRSSLGSIPQLPR